MSKKPQTENGKIKEPLPATKDEAKAAPPAHQTKKPLLDRSDYIIMAVMAVVYLGVALVNLGRLDVPKTGWKPVKAGESFVLKLDRPRVISRVYYYAGLGDGRDASRRYRLEFMDGVGNYYPLAVIDKKEIFTWKYLNTSAVLTDRIKLTVEAPGGTLNELEFVERDSKAPIMFSIVYVLKGMSEKYRGWRYISYAYLAAVAVLFIVFYPALSGMEVSQGYIEHLKWLKSWYF